ncbi:hypothetical protein L9F63_017917, partial [Diploptera punctata]
FKCTSCERSLNYATKMARMLQSSTYMPIIYKHVVDLVAYSPVRYLDAVKHCIDLEDVLQIVQSSGAM